ncbi:GNAT family N-acetyltransferase [Tenacibaculum discolor]|uniref:GNAT family N-acetyltransferase n=1 Tax=Tenacibaculum discolor TaxID=361581 RepID=A0A2G1BYR2_9FLAO|nr:GNAT family N-acetyltransferase [Tenacibaculum discolor]MDP2541360.1 GNAT family N-acetyltransferase [Tenacibaculum discolor]PHN99183.1 GNAT family N-acetyltransferase [Tenacibaculum discolor]PHN99999.1 GNAT family N-acetyltransferase [Rhodobacteraceae bacterium 4F10]
MIKIKNISAQETYEIRLAVLRNNIDLPYKFKEDEFENTFHLGAFYNNKLVGIASFMRNRIDVVKGEQYQLRGMATLPEVRGMGAGRSLIEEAKRTLKAKDINVLWCNARKEAVGFYESLNFVTIGEEFEVQKVGPHFKMYYIVK